MGQVYMLYLDSTLMNYRQRVGNNKHTVDGFRAYASYGLIHSDDHSRFNTKRQIEGAHTYEQTSEKGAFFFFVDSVCFYFIFFTDGCQQKEV